MSLSATLFGRDSAIHRVTNILGLGIPGWLDKKFGPPETEGPRLSDLSVQTSTYGAFVPRVYGTIGIHGNLLWLENGRIKETVRKKKKGGKGGGGASDPDTTYSYSATFALGLCQGPIAGVRRIWCADKLIYNAGSDDLETIIASNQNAKGWKLYLGTDDQLPDPRYEANVGVGNASAFRGIAYLAFYDFQLADYSNTLQAAQFKVEVVGPSEFGASVVLDVAPYVQTAMTWESGAAFRDDFTGLYYCSRRAVGSADVSDLSLGNSGPGVTYTVESNLDNQAARGIVSYDGEMWIGAKINDIFGTNKYRRTSDLYYFEINSDTLVRGIRKWFGGTEEDSYVFLYTSGGAGTSGTYTKIGYTQVFVDGGILTHGMDASVGYRLNTCGDQVHEFRVVSNTISVKRYSESFALVESYSVSVAGDVLENVTSAFGAQGLGSQSCMRDGLLYLCQEIAGGYRIVICNSSGVIDDFSITANSGAAQLYGFYMASSAAGYIVNGTHVIQFTHYPSGAQPLAKIIEAEVALSGMLSEADVNVSALQSTVRGYRVNGGSIRAAIEPLQGAFPFDVIPSGYQIKCVPRGQVSVATIPWEDLGATDGGEPGDILKQAREMDSQLPARTTITYLDAAREYATSEQYAERINTEAINRVDRELPLVLNADEAAGVAEVLQNLAWLERTDFACTLPPTYLHLEPADVITVTTPQAAYQLRITEPNYTPDGRIECKAKPNRAALYTPNATGGEGVPPIGTVPLPGESIFLALDIPVVDETLQNDVGFVGVMTGTTNSWPGGLLVRSNDGGQTWADLQGFAGKATIGTARGTLPASNATLIDQRSLIVDLISGELESVTRDQMLSGVNYAAYGLDGRWEIVRFQSATLQGDGGYLVSGFVRGERGTEWATGLHAAGDYFVLLDDPDNAFIGLPVESIALPRLYRGVTSGASVDSATDVPFTYQGVNLECLGPVYAKGSRDGSSNFTGTFTRRSRLSSSWWTTGVEAPLGETTQAYEIDVMNGSTVARTIAAGTPTFAYSAANQTTDFGSPQASITFRIYQLSATVGRGYAYEVTL